MSLSHLSILRDGLVIAELNAENQLVIGSSVGCDLVLTERGVSREHCKIEFLDEEWFLEDLRSTNGVKLNGSKIDGKAKLPIFCLLEVGVVQLEIAISAPDQKTELLGSNHNGSGRGPTELFSHNRMVDGYSEGMLVNSSSESKDSPMLRMQTIQGLGQKLERAALSRQGTPVNVSSHESPVVVGTYVLGKRLGSGGMGEVYIATNQVDKTLWAIKLLKPEQNLNEVDRARFIREMKITMALQHSALIKCVDCSQNQEQLYIVMEYCNGGNLMDLLQRSGPLTIRRSIRLILRLLEGIAHAHQQGIVHRDLKPSNILLHKDAQGKYHPRISDFGLAKSFIEAGNSGMTINGTVGGSWAYMPREQLTNFRFVSPQSDVWSMGAILYECFTKKLPRFFPPKADPIRTVLESNVTPIGDVMPELPKPIAFVLMRSLEKELKDRYLDAVEMHQALREAAVVSGVEL